MQITKDIYKAMMKNKAPKINMQDVTVNKRKLSIKLKKNETMKKVMSLATHSYRAYVKALEESEIDLLKEMF